MWIIGLSAPHLAVCWSLVLCRNWLSLNPLEGAQLARTFPFQVQEQAKDRASNPFLNKKGPQLLEASVFQTVQQIPGVGKTKALLLLERFGNIHQLCNATLQELEQVVGRAVAQQIHTFFTQT